MATYPNVSMQNFEAELYRRKAEIGQLTNQRNLHVSPTHPLYISAAVRAELGRRRTAPLNSHLWDAGTANNKRYLILEQPDRAFPLGHIMQRYRDVPKQLQEAAIEVATDREVDSIAFTQNVDRLDLDTPALRAAWVRDQRSFDALCMSPAVSESLLGKIAVARGIDDARVIALEHGGRENIAGEVLNLRPSFQLLFLVADTYVITGQISDYFRVCLTRQGICALADSQNYVHVEFPLLLHRVIVAAWPHRDVRDAWHAAAGRETDRRRLHELWKFILTNSPQGSSTGTILGSFCQVAKSSIETRILWLQAHDRATAANYSGRPPQPGRPSLLDRVDRSPLDVRKRIWSKVIEPQP